MAFLWIRGFFLYYCQFNCISKEWGRKWNSAWTKKSIFLFQLHLPFSKSVFTCNREQLFIQLQCWRIHNLIIFMRSTSIQTTNDKNYYLILQAEIFFSDFFYWYLLICVLFRLQTELRRRKQMRSGSLSMERGSFEIQSNPSWLIHPNAAKE